MSWSETIRLSRPLCEVWCLAEAPSESWDTLLAERERAAYERGRRDGEAALGEQLVQQRTEIADLQRGILESLGQAVPQVIKESETALIALALEAAQRIVAGLPVDARLVETVVLEALRQAEDNAEILVQLHADDLALLRKNECPVLKGVPEKGPLRFSASADVTRGGCVVQTRFGLIDARREVKLEQLAQTLAS
jgi:flagellar assembly protein FliH